MGEYLVTADSMEGRQYVYRVTAPSPGAAVRMAYALHGQSVREGHLPDYLSHSHYVELVG